MSGICGWLGSAGGDPPEVIARMMARFAWAGQRARAGIAEPGWGLAAVGAPDTAAVVDEGVLSIALHGHPRWKRGDMKPTSIESASRMIAQAYSERGASFLDDLTGDFSLALVDKREGVIVLAIDRIGVRNIVYQQAREAFVFGATSDVVAAHPLARSTADPQAIYDYVYFHMVPGPRTIYREHTRLAPAHYLVADGRTTTTRAYWHLRFVEDGVESIDAYKPAFRAALRAGVEAYANDGRCGAFLSGGTDSSTVSGIIGEVTGKPASTYSIGFDAAGYDEMRYARIAARHFHTDHHEYYVSPDDVLRAIPLIAAAYDQPFGNASAVPTYYCARLAKAHNIERLLGGDGGDELFGGNDRYAKQYQLALYGRLPAAARAVLSTLLFDVPGANRIALIRRARSYVEQARRPMPARYQSYNLLERIGADQVFNRDFLAHVEPDLPMKHLQAVYDSADATSLINRMLALDIKFTLADNDLPKVTRTCDLAGIDVAFPLLHEAVTDFSTTLPPDFKLRRTRLRYFFKEALRDFLPADVIAKTKHGFGLPAGPWLRDHAPLHELASDAIGGLRKRGYFNDGLLDTLMTHRLREHPGYYGTLAWVFMTLEMWFVARERDNPQARIDDSAAVDNCIAVRR